MIASEAIPDRMGCNPLGVLSLVNQVSVRTMIKHALATTSWKNMGSRVPTISGCSVRRDGREIVTAGWDARLSANHLSHFPAY